MEYSIINLILRGKYLLFLALIYLFIVSSVSAQNFSMLDSSVYKLASYKSNDIKK